MNDLTTKADTAWGEKKSVQEARDSTKTDGMVPYCWKCSQQFMFQSCKQAISS